MPEQHKSMPEAGIEPAPHSVGRDFKTLQPLAATDTSLHGAARDTPTSAPSTQQFPQQFSGIGFITEATLGEVCAPLRPALVRALAPPKNIGGINVWGYTTIGALLSRRHEIEVPVFAPDKDSPWSVYVMRRDGLDEVKIGITRNVKMRRRDIQCAHGARVRVLLHFRAQKCVERELHFILDHERKLGEWFRHSPRLQRWVERQKEASRGSA